MPPSQGRPIIIPHTFTVVNTFFTLFLYIGRLYNVKKGKAYIVTELDDNEINKYEIEITEVREQNCKNTKGFSFKVTDELLISKTNGIIQGMSGSPIIQDTKLIGAVTHVIVDNCHHGHAIYIRFMIDVLNNK